MAFFMVLDFLKLEFHVKLEFQKLELKKCGKFLNISVSKNSGI